VLDTLKVSKEKEVLKECTFKPKVGKGIQRNDISTLQESGVRFNIYLNTMKYCTSEHDGKLQQNSHEHNEEKVMNKEEKRDVKKLKMNKHSKSVKLIKTVKQDKRIGHFDHSSESNCRNLLFR
jgi:hypothetical protein